MEPPVNRWLGFEVVPYIHSMQLKDIELLYVIRVFVLTELQLSTAFLWMATGSYLHGLSYKLSLVEVCYLHPVHVLPKVSNFHVRLVISKKY